MGDFLGAFAMMVQDLDTPPNDENRNLAKAERKRRWKLRYRSTQTRSRRLLHNSLSLR